jgi:hypothetical protein
MIQLPRKKQRQTSSQIALPDYIPSRLTITIIITMELRMKNEVKIPSYN